MWINRGTNWAGFVVAAIFIIGLIAVFSYIWSYAIWWALTYLQIIHIEWNLMTWFAIVLITSVISGIGAKLRR